MEAGDDSFPDQAKSGDEQSGSEPEKVEMNLLHRVPAHPNITVLKEVSLSR